MNENSAQHHQGPESGQSFFRASITIMDDYGLHARPAANLAKTAQEFNSEIRLRTAAQSADAKSILDILSLAAGRNAELTLECRGDDAAQAGHALLRLFQDRYQSEAER